MNFNRLFKVVQSSYNLLDLESRKKFKGITILQSFLALLDLIAVYLVGLLASVSVLGVQSRPTTVSNSLKLLGINNLQFQLQVAIIAGLAGIMLILKTAISAILVWRTTRYYSFLGAGISQELLSKFLNQPINKISEKSTQQSIYNLTSGVNNIVVGIISTTSALISDLVLIILMIGALFMASPIVALFAFILFSTLGILLHFTVGQRSRIIAQEMVPKSIELNESIITTLESYRELFVRNLIRDKTIKAGLSMRNLAQLSAKQSFLPHVSKYVIEIILIFVVLSFALIQVFLTNAVDSAGVLAIFLAASSRVAPAALRVQQGLASIMNGYGGGKVSIDLYQELQSSPEIDKAVNFMVTSNNKVNLNTTQILEVSDLSFSYNNKKMILYKVNLDVLRGQRVLLMGKTGAGKSTLLDAILGLITPDNGQVLLFGKPPREAISNLNNKIAFVSQRPYLFNGTIFENVCEGQIEYTPEEIWHALRFCEIDGFIRDLPLGLESSVLENGKNLSGGQRQRLSLTKAILSRPKLLILDEATSALDSDTESKILQKLLNHDSIETIIMISHSVPNINAFDKVGFLEGNRLLYDKPREVIKKSSNHGSRKQTRS